MEKLAPLFERHHHQLFNFFVQLTGNREASEDLVQDVFLRILKYRHTFREPGEFTTWMYQIARHANHDAWRKQRPEARKPDEAAPQEAEPVCPAPTPDERLSQTQEFTLLQQALARLPASQREILVLSQIQRMKYDAIAAILECEIGTVKVRVHRALKALQEIFHQMNQEKRL